MLAWHQQIATSHAALKNNFILTTLCQNVWKILSLKVASRRKVLNRNVYRTLDHATKQELVSITEKLSQSGKGILVADESPGNIGQKLAAIKTENTLENRRQFGQLLFSAKDIGLQRYLFNQITHRQ